MIRHSFEALSNFRSELERLFNWIDKKESEEFHKTRIRDFLTSIYSDEYYINTKSSNDLVIHNHNSPESAVGVLIEVKNPLNKLEMISREDLNRKSLHELILYFLRERISSENLQIRNLIITNTDEWFLFDSSLFETLFAKDQKLIELFREFESGALSFKKTEDFYKQIAAPLVKKIESKLKYEHFSLREYFKSEQQAIEDNEALLRIHSLLTPERLLKLPYANENNILDKNFYSELLHILGLEEVRDGSKKLIKRKSENSRETGSLIENTIIQLESRGITNSIRGVKNSNHNEKTLDIAIELSITWINRILFTKLLEAQLLNFQNQAKEYKFMTSKLLRTFDDFDKMFFQVLAVNTPDRNPDVIDNFKAIPYLNSTLFEPTETEQKTIYISNLNSTSLLTILPKTVLRDGAGKRRKGKLRTTDYIIEFLDSYDFSSDLNKLKSKNEKTLISPSVLGLIFEKINGYKEGSFYTPGNITTYMCRNTIRRAVVNKFNDTKGWNCKSISDVYNSIKIDEIQEANTIINSIRICDPAVGSGHFLVSALNELITIKHDLKILIDNEGKRLKEYSMNIVNDELYVIDSDGIPFSYKPTNPESQRVQETIFNEKRFLIENCLFGVDININSVKICRLRLWIELLKNAYYRNDGSLETLPNIDINIKCGNSMISKFSLDTKILKTAKTQNWARSYQSAVKEYRKTRDKVSKHKIERLIIDIKQDIISEIYMFDPQFKKRVRLKKQITELESKLIPLDNEELEKYRLIKQQLAEVEKSFEDAKSNKAFKDSFEWRFEFPDVLDDSGNYLGFDAIIGNPPYLTYHGRRRVELDNRSREYFRSNYTTIIDKSGAGKFNSVMFFIEKSFAIGSKNACVNFLIDIAFYEGFFAKTMQMILDKSKVLELVRGLNDFEDVGSGQLILEFERSTELAGHHVKYRHCGLRSQVEIIPQESWKNSTQMFKRPSSGDEIKFIHKIEQGSILLSDLFPGKLIRTGESIGPKETGFVFDELVPEKIETMYPYVEGSKSLKDRYSPISPTRFFDYNQNLLNMKNSEYRKQADLAGKKNAKVLGIGDLKAFLNPKILIRQSCDYLCASFSEEVFVYNRSFYSISNENSSGKSDFSLFYVLGIINSTLMTIYARHKGIIKLEEGKQPQIRLADLKKLPIRPTDSETIQKIETLVSNLLKSMEQNSQESGRLIRELDACISNIYGIEEEELQQFSTKN